MSLMRKAPAAVALALVFVGSSCNFQSDRASVGTDPVRSDGGIVPPADASSPYDGPIVIDGSSCTPISCTNGGTQYCGKIGNGCNGTIDCGGCPTNQTCGAFVPGVCGDPACTPTVASCTVAGGTYCGMIGDGCGRAVDCGAGCS